MKHRILNWFLWALGTGVILTSTACTRPGEPQVVKVAVPVDCEIEQVPASTLPPANSAMNVFELSRTALAQLRTVQAENLRLRAANANPCPAVR